MDKTEQRVPYPWETPQPSSGFPPLEIDRPVGCEQPLAHAVCAPEVCAEAIVPASPLPSAPAYVLAHAFQKNQATLLWGQAEGADGYLLLRGESQSGLKPVAAVEEASYIDSRVCPGRTYYYAVRAYNEHGQSAATTAAAVTIPAGEAAAPLPEQNAVAFPGKRLRVQKKLHRQAQDLQKADQSSQNVPAAPSDLRAKICGTRLVELQWQGGASGGSDGTEYRLYRSATPWCSYGLIAETKVCRFLDTVPEAGTKYYYFVQAVREGRASPASAMAEALAFPQLPLPEPPERLRASPVNLDAIELRWSHARGAAAYVVCARMEDEDFRVVGHTQDGGFLHEGLPLDVNVDYRVLSYHDTGVSEPSAVCTARTGGQRPGNAQRNVRPPAAVPQNRKFPSFSLQPLQNPHAK